MALGIASPVTTPAISDENSGIKLVDFLEVSVKIVLENP
jgi:hypothetical protein